MRHPIRITVFAVMMMALLLGCASRTVDELAEAKWVEMRTEHFILYSEVGEYWPRRMITQLQSFRSFVIDHMGLQGAENPLPFRIVLLRNARSIQAIVPLEGVFGLYQPTYRGGLALVDVSARVEDGTSSLEITYTPNGPIYRKRTGTRYVSMDGVLHEYVHHLLANDPERRYPLWFNEGYAEYLSTFSIDNDGLVTIGAPPMHRVEALQNTRWMPLQTLFQMQGYDHGHGYGDLYAQAWAVVHYMLSDPDRAQQTEQFLDRLNRKEDIEQSFEASFEIALRELSASARAKVRTKRLSKQKLEIEPVKAVLSEPRSMPGDEVSLLLAEMIMTFSPRREDARDYLARALLQNPGNNRARALAANLEMYLGKTEAAEKILSEAGATGDLSPDIQCQWGHFYTDYAIDSIQDGRSDHQKWVNQARGHYEKALALDAYHAEAYLGLGRTYLLSFGDQTTKGFDALTMAHKLLPTNLETQLLIGHLLYASGQYQAAKPVYQEVVAWSRDTLTVNRAKDMLGLIEQEQGQESIGPSPE